MLPELMGGVISSIATIVIVELIYSPMRQRFKLRKAVGDYGVYSAYHEPIGPHGKLNTVQLSIKGWINPVIHITGKDNDTNYEWTARLNVDLVLYRATGPFVYGVNQNSGMLELVAYDRNMTRWFCQTRPYHTPQISAFMWNRIDK